MHQRAFAWLMLRPQNMPAGAQDLFTSAILMACSIAWIPAAMIFAYHPMLPAATTPRRAVRYLQAPAPAAHRQVLVRLQAVAHRVEQVTPAAQAMSMLRIG